MKAIAKYLITALLCAAGASWAADWNAPTITTPYVNYTDGLKARDVDSARLFDPAYTSPSNVPQYTIRWNGAQDRLERWSGSAWGPLVLGITGGGCGASSAANCRTALGLAIGTNVQAYDADLTSLAGLNSTGFSVRTAANTWAQRTLTATGTGLSISNGNGVPGNPTFSLSENLQGFSGKSVPTGNVVGTTDSQMLTGKRFGDTVHVGSGTTPVTWGPEVNVVQVGEVGAFVGNSASHFVYMTNNMYWDGGVGDWLKMQSGGAGKLTITNAGVLRYEATNTGGDGDPANEQMALEIGTNGHIVSYAPCATGYTRAAPGFCRRNVVPLFAMTNNRDTCTAMVLPGDAGSVLMEVIVAAHANNSVGTRTATTKIYSATNCSGASEVYSVAAIAYESPAISGVAQLGSSQGTVVIPANASYRYRVATDGNASATFLGGYRVIGYWDN